MLFVRSPAFRILLVPILLWTLAISITRVAIASPEECGQVTPESLRDAARQAGDWIIRGQQPDGRYTYEYFAAQGQAGSDYNIVRHAGATLGLYELAGKLDDHDALAAADRGLAWELQHMVSRDDWTALGDDDSPSLGSAALMSAGLAERRLATGDRQYDDVMLGLGKFMLQLQRDDGGFYVSFHLAENQPDLINTSIYYPGEAMWALALLHEAFPGQGFDTAALRAGDFIALHRDEVEQIKWPPLNDHWASYAFAEMSDWGLPDDQIAYARRLAERFGFLMRAEAQNQADSLGDFARGPNRRGASLGTWVEGMAALWRLSATDPRMADMRAEILTRASCGRGSCWSGNIRPKPARRWPERGSRMA